MAQVAERLTSATFVQDALIRKKPVRKSAWDASARDYGIQFDSLEADRTSLSDIASVIVVDDITTSGATMAAAINLILNCNPSISLTAFTFGKTKQTGSTSFPEDPEFPGEPPGGADVNALTMAIEVKLESHTEDQERSPGSSNPPGLAEIDGLSANEQEQSDIELSSDYDALPRSADAPSGTVEGWSVELVKIYSDTIATALTTLTELVVREGDPASRLSTIFDEYQGAKQQVFDGAGHLILECYLNPFHIALIQYTYTSGLLTEKRCYGPTGALAKSEEGTQQYYLNDDYAAVTKYEYDDGKLLKIEFFGSDENLIRGDNSVAIEEWEYDYLGRAIEMRLLTDQDVLAVNVGFSVLQWEWDENGRIVEQRGLDEDRELTDLPSADLPLADDEAENTPAVVQWIYDNLGFVEEERYLDSNRRLTDRATGHAIVVYRRNYHGIETKHLFLDKHRKLVSRKVLNRSESEYPVSPAQYFLPQMRPTGLLGIPSSSEFERILSPTKSIPGGVIQGRISLKEAKKRFKDIRDEATTEGTNLHVGLFSDEMCEALWQVRPKSREEFRELIPLNLREQVDPDNFFSFGDRILEIFALL